MNKSGDELLLNHETFALTAIVQKRQLGRKRLRVVMMMTILMMVMILVMIFVWAKNSSLEIN